MSALSIHSLWGLRLLWSALGDDPAAGGGGSGEGGARDHHRAGSDGVERDLLLNRLIEGRAAGRDWLDLRDSVISDPTLWEHLSGPLQGDEGTLCSAVAGQVALADRVDLPGTADERDFDGASWPAVGGRGWKRPGKFAAWGGWAVAAALGLAFVSTQGLVGPSWRGPSGQAGLSSGLGLTAGTASPGADYQEALDRYVQLGQEAGSVLGELPHRVVVSTQPTEDGRIEVVYIRQLLERTIVDNAFRLGTDEAGRPRLVPSVIPGVGDGGAPL